MPSGLSPFRRIEAKRVLTHMFEREAFDAEDFVDRLAEIMMRTPPVVAFVTRRLKEWNTTEQNFATADDTDMYEQIVEFVLDHAAMYRGEASEDPTPEDTSEDANAERKVADQLDAVVTFLIAVASGRTNRDLAQTHANNMASIAVWLKKRKFKHVTE